MNKWLSKNWYNVFTSANVTTKELAKTIQKITGHKGKIVWDSSKPGSTPRKPMDSSKMKALGWKAQTELHKGIERTYKWLLGNEDSLKKFKHS